MKKRLLTMMLALTAIVTGAWAETRYSIQLGDLQLPNVSNDNITGDCITHGTASFDVDTYTLTLNNVTIENVNSSFYFSGISYYAYGEDAPELTVKLIGKNVLPFVDVWHDESHNGKVTFIGADNSASVITEKIRDYMTNLYFNGCIFTVTTEGILISDSMTGCTLGVENATLDVNNTYNDIALFMMGEGSQLLLGEGISILEPVGGVFGEYDHSFSAFSVCTDETLTTPASHVIIGPKQEDKPVTKYGLWVGAVQVTSENAGNITGEHITAGMAIFDAESSTLTLRSTVIEQVSAIVIGDSYDCDTIRNLTVNLIGTNVSKSYENGIYAAYCNDVDLRFVSDNGNGEMIFSRPNFENENLDEWILGSWVFLPGIKNVTIDHCIVRAGEISSEGGKMTVTNGATLEVGNGRTGRGALWGFSDLVFGEGIGFIRPATGAVYHGAAESSDSNNWRLDYTGDEEFDTYLIGPKTEEEEPVVIEPITGDETTTVTIGEDIDEQTDLENTEVGGILYTLSEEEGDGYDPTDESIVLNSTVTTEELIELLGVCEPGSEEFAGGFNGLTFLLPAGRGEFEIEGYTLGNRWLTVKVGDNATLTFSLTERGTVNVTYYCTEDTYVFIYGTTAEAQQARAQAATVGENALKIYSITVKPGDVSGIKSTAAAATDGVRKITENGHLYILLPDGRKYSVEGVRLNR